MPADGPPPADTATPTVQGMIRRMQDATGGTQTAVDDLLATLAGQGQAVLLLVPALILVSPLSGIPGLSSLGGLTIALVAAQMLIGRHRIWLPGFVLRRKIASTRLHRALDWLSRPAAIIDRRLKPRAQWMFMVPGQKLLLLVCVLCGMVMPFLELVPFSASALATVVSILAAAMVVRDGVLAGAGLVVLGVAGALLGRIVAA